MPCFRCDARQTDPARGKSPWRQAVVRGEQVLVCPDCQRSPNWTAQLDRCARCESVRLVKALGVVRCKDCQAVNDTRPAEPADPPGTSADAPPPTRAAGPAGTAGGTGISPAAGRSPSLAAEVEAALARVLGRAPS